MPEDKGDKEEDPAVPVSGPHTAQDDNHREQISTDDVSGVGQSSEGLLDDLLDETGQSSHEQISQQGPEPDRESKSLAHKTTEQEQHMESTTQQGASVSLELEPEPAPNQEMGVGTQDAESQQTDDLSESSRRQVVEDSDTTGQQSAQQPPNSLVPSTSDDRSPPPNRESDPLGSSSVSQEDEVDGGSPRAGVFGLVAYPDSPTSSEEGNDGDAMTTQPLDRDPETGEPLQHQQDATLPQHEPPQGREEEEEQMDPSGQDNVQIQEDLEDMDL
jgi:hypothetical protein